MYPAIAALLVVANRVATKLHFKWHTGVLQAASSYQRCKCRCMTALCGVEPWLVYAGWRQVGDTRASVAG